MSTIRLSTAAAIAVFAFLAVGVSPVSAAPIVECGQLSAYTAPDPTGPTAGNLQIGLLPAWEVLATATVSSGAAVTLPSIVNTGPTCLALDFDTDDKITAIDFAPEGEITGNVDYDSGSGFYVFADRLIVPNFITDAYPGLAALFVTSYQAGTVLAVKFTVDTSTGAFVGFDGQADFCGTASLTAGGDAQIGDAVIPSSVLDPDDIADVLGAGDRAGMRRGPCSRDDPARTKRRDRGNDRRRHHGRRAGRNAVRLHPDDAATNCAPNGSANIGRAAWRPAGNRAHGRAGRRDPRLRRSRRDRHPKIRSDPGVIGSVG